MSELCCQIHNLFNSLHRYTTMDDFNLIPQNGIYVMFEKGEKAHEFDRIVRVGTHTGQNQLPSRMQQHFYLENKNRSIFRKNIGRCFLKDDSYLEKWEYDTTSRAGKEKYLKLIDSVYEREMEQKITEYIQKNISFIILPVQEKSERLRLESAIISTVAQCNSCKPSSNWLGNFSPKTKIRESGLWLVNELNKEILTKHDIELISNLIK